ncbi:signal peptidase I [Desulfatibacillum aliphaticivorans]|uniref:Signal peptidase I n=1 Tax=Desulfatibacillum aliphaticivorans TaxID=218208 RepID=B8FJ24_DESAL|nr:signal peptidase I [Desulfatibacillum aliphaticivorans]ACL04951.1 signal peptidase I [Desulfatibacillum aliphaticivorans]
MSALHWNVFLSAAQPPPITSRKKGPPGDKLKMILGLGTFVFIIAALILLKIFVFGTYKSPSGSMAPTIVIGDHFFVSKLAYKGSIPDRGDVIVFKYPMNESLDYVKRVIAREGEKVTINDGIVYVNNKRIKEDYVQFLGSEYGIKVPPMRNFGPVTIPPGKLFVLGDNRDSSSDSRYWGFVPMENVKGKALFIYWSENEDRVRSDRIGGKIH